MFLPTGVRRCLLKYGGSKQNKRVSWASFSLKCKENMDSEKLSKIKDL